MWHREKAVKVEDIFIGYHADCAASTVLHVCQENGLSKDIKDDVMADKVSDRHNYTYIKSL